MQALLDGHLQVLNLCGEVLLLPLLLLCLKLVLIEVADAKVSMLDLVLLLLAGQF